MGADFDREVDSAEISSKESSLELPSEMNDKFSVIGIGSVEGTNFTDLLLIEETLKRDSSNKFS